MGLSRSLADMILLRFYDEVGMREHARLNTGDYHGKDRNDRTVTSQGKVRLRGNRKGMPPRHKVNAERQAYDSAMTSRQILGSKVIEYTSELSVVSLKTRNWNFLVGRDGRRIPKGMRALTLDDIITDEIAKWAVENRLTVDVVIDGGKNSEKHL